MVALFTLYIEHSQFSPPASTCTYFHPHEPSIPEVRLHARAPHRSITMLADGIARLLASHLDSPYFKKSSGIIYSCFM